MCQEIESYADVTDNDMLVFDDSNPQAFNRAKGLCYRDCVHPLATLDGDINTRAECRMSYVKGDADGFDGKTAMHRC